MNKTSLGLLALSAVAAAVVSFAAVWVFYGSFPPLRISGSTALWIFAVVAGVLAWTVRRRIAAGEVGQDSSQMSPVFISRCAVFGAAAGWIGALLGGAYGGVAVYLLLRHGELLAAQQDTPGAVVGFLASAAMAVAGVLLERSCLVPPGDGDEHGDGDNDGKRGRGDVFLTP